MADESWWSVMSYAEVYQVAKKSDAGHHSIRFKKNSGMTWRDYLITLLHIAAEAEHGLMVQYLYAAYSLGGSDLSPSKAAKVAKWQKSILEVAKEEMGHLLTVQNLLALLGAPPNFRRAETGFEEALSPIPFVLDPLTRETVASFTFAEMSPDLEAHLQAGGSEIRKSLKAFLAHHQLGLIKEQTEQNAQSITKRKLKPQPVSLLYEEIIRVFGDADLIPDNDFDEMSYQSQASWDDWGRGYAHSPKLVSASGDVISSHMGSNRANVIVMRAATRTEALLALRAISGQGEAVHLRHPFKKRNKSGGDSSETSEDISHFERFLSIWQKYPEDWQPCRNLMRNPATTPSAARHRTIIQNAEALDWALLFNIRYRMLLTFLTHSYRLSRVVRPGEPNLRGMVMHRAFGEMYNLKTIAGILVQIKVSKPGEQEVFAGPPFETPYSLNMPAADVDCFRLHRDLYLGAIALSKKLESNSRSLGQSYLQSLRELDKAALRWIDGILRAPEEREGIT
jgi:hypothetical protein